MPNIKNIKKLHISSISYNNKLIIKPEQLINSKYTDNLLNSFLGEIERIITSANIQHRISLQGARFIGNSP